MKTHFLLGMKYLSPIHQPNPTWIGLSWFLTFYTFNGLDWVEKKAPTRPMHTPSASRRSLGFQQHPRKRENPTDWLRVTEGYSSNCTLAPIGKD